MLSLSQFLTRAARVNRGGVATIEGNRRHTWAKVLDRVQRTASMLQGLGLKPGERVAILSLNSNTFFEYLFAVGWAGGVVVPINTRLAVPEVQYWLQDCGAKIFAVGDPFIEMVDSLRDQLDVEQYVYLGDGETPNGYVHHESTIAAAEPAVDAGRGGDDLAALFYTGGTTGRSKGVMITHAGMFANVLQWISAVGVNDQDRFLIIPPMFHAAGGENCFAAAALAATACIMPRFDVEAGLQAIQDERLTKLALVATMLDMMANHPRAGEFDLSSVRLITYGASPIHQQTLKRAQALFPEASFIQIFGQTEGGPTVTALAPRYHDPSQWESGKIKSAGVPIVGTEVTILNEQGNELPDNTVGEIAVRGPGVSPGYWNLPEETEASRAGDWLRTGDAGYLDDDGFLYISDRIKDMIISGAENVYPAEVEVVLMKRDDIAECAVIGIPSEKWGEQVHGIVRLNAGQDTNEAELIDYCRQHLAGYKCPRSIEFRDEPLPLSATNKILKRELRKPYWDGRERSI